MKALVLSKKVPYPSLDGECLVIQQDIEMFLTLGYHVDLLSLNTDKHYIDKSKYEVHTPENVKLYPVDIITAIKIKDLILNFFSDIPYNIERFFLHEFKNKLIELLRINTYDIIVFEGLHMHLYAKEIKDLSNAKLIMRSHNVESEIWKRKSDLESNLLKKWYLQFLSKKILTFEKSSFETYRQFIAISDRDLELYRQLGMKTPSFTLPYTINNSMTDNADSAHLNKSIFFIGSFDWLPNYEGISWFIERVWVRLHVEFPELKFFIAGRKMNINDPIFQKAGIVALGEIPDTARFMKDHPVMIVPLFFGSGIRIKIIEALFRGKIIVSTATGAEGVYEKPDSPIYIANDELSFLNTLKNLFESKNEIYSLRIKSIDFAHLHFDYNTFVQRLALFIQNN